jgi:hypothetical protein
MGDVLSEIRLKNEQEYRAEIGKPGLGYMGLNKEEVAEIQSRNLRDYNQLLVQSRPPERVRAASEWSEVRETSPALVQADTNQLGRCQSCAVIFTNNWKYKLCGDCYKQQK